MMTVLKEMREKTLYINSKCSSINFNFYIALCNISMCVCVCVCVCVKYICLEQLHSNVLVSVLTTFSSDGNPPAMQENWVQSLDYLWIGKIPWRKEWQSIPVFLLRDPTDRGA